MKNIHRYLLSIFLIFIVFNDAHASDTQWNVGVNIGSGFPSSPVPHRYSPNKPGMKPFHRPLKPQQHSHSLNIIYKAPSYTTYHQNTYMWVNGDPNVAQIESSSYKVITQWQELGLPPPPDGMYWIFENGRYMLMEAQ